MAELRFPGLRGLAVCIVVLALAAAPALPAAALAAALSVPGDANGDGVVNLFDLVIISRAQNTGASAADARADVNGDGTVDVLDLVFVGLRLAAVPPATPPTSQRLPGRVYTLDSERIMAGYAVRLWRPTDSQPTMHHLLTIDRAGHSRVTVEDVMSLGSLTGGDVTGEGNADVVMLRFTLGAHCCFSTVIYDLGPVLSKVLETPLSNCPAWLVNLDGDAAFEVETCDDIFAYRYCSYAGSPMPHVVLDYAPGEGYVPASPRFAQLYAADIVTDTLAAERSVAADGCGASKCAVLAVVLDYLYAGNSHQAWSELNRLYTCPDADTFAAEIRAIAESSPLYTP
jgi:hypothetical protein